MTSLSYLIVCVNLLYYFHQAESLSRYRSWSVKQNELRVLVNSLTVENQDESLALLVSPFYKRTYDEQLFIKQDACSFDFGIIMQRSGSMKNLLSYKLLQIVPSPVTEAYRNRDEFHINYGVDGNRKTVGCLFGSPTIGKIYSIHPTTIVTIRESHKRVAQVYEDFIRLSPIAASIRRQDGGHWSSIIVRSNEAGDVMAIVTVKPQGNDTTLIMEQQQLLKEYFIKHLPKITLYHQVCPIKRCTHNISPFNLLYGKPTLMDTIRGFKFEISPDSIFPNNVMGAEMLYDSIIRVAKLNPKTTVLDLYSASGTNSIIISIIVKEVVGFEPVQIAVEEAKHLANLNNIQNVKFLFGGVNDNMISVLKSLKTSSNVVAILNHRLRRLETDIIKTIRKSFQISTVVYMAYRPNSKTVINNIVELCSWNNSNVPPFSLKEVIPIDLLPHTEHIELILMFHRLEPMHYK